MLRTWHVYTKLRVTWAAKSPNQTLQQAEILINEWLHQHASDHDYA